MEEEQGAQELGIMEGFLEEAMSKQRFKEWEVVSLAGREDGGGWDQHTGGGSGVERHSPELSDRACRGGARK